MFCDYIGKRGEDYTVTVRRADKDVEERKTNWRTTSGKVLLFFDDVLVSASGNIDAASLSKLGPWDLNELVKTNDQYLTGFVTEKYQIKLMAGFEAAKKYTKSRIESAIRSDIGGDRQIVDAYETNYYDIQFKHILLPVYVSTYQYKDKRYNFYVNGKNGKLIGKRPYSAMKIIIRILWFFAILAILCLLAMLV